MTSPLWLWRLAVALGAVAAGAIALAALSATRAVRLDDGALHALLDACRSYLLPEAPVHDGDVEHDHQHPDAEHDQGHPARALSLVWASFGRRGSR